MANPLDSAGLYKRYQEAQTARGLGSLFQEEGPGRTGAPRLLPVIDPPPFIRKVDDDRSFGDYFQSDKNVVDRVKEYFKPKYKQGSFGSFQRDDDRVVRFGLPEDFSQEEISRALADIKNVPAGSTLADRKDVAEVAKRLEGLPEDDPIFAGSPLDALSMDIDNILSALSEKKQRKRETESEEKQRKKEAEEFRAEEAKIADAQGLQGKPPEQVAFEAGIDEFIKAARGTEPDVPKIKTIEEYKKIFSDATGIDVSGAVDKSQALMAFGLALMQNRAGKGFNVGKILSAIGEAGKAALPALEKAKESAKQAALAAGKYALETRAADRSVDAANREKSLNRQGYYVFERGADMEDGNKKFKDGQIVYLNPEELNKLITNPDFEKNYSFIEKNDYIDVMKELTKPVELGDMWVKGDPPAFSLIGGDAKDVPPALQVLSHSKNPNYEGETPSRRLLAEDEEDVKNRLTRYQQELAKNQVMLNKLVKNLQAGVSFPKQIADNVKQIAKSLGLNVDTSSTAKAKQALANIAIDNVLQILKESGRTISEGERKRAEKRVSKVDLSLEGSDLDLILNQVEYVYDMVVTDAQKNLDNALDSFENNFGYSIIPNITQDELDELNAKRKADGKKLLTMDDF